MKSSKSVTSMFILAAAVMSSAASASTYTVVTPVDQALFVNFATPSVGIFSDTYNFTISSISDAAASITNHQLKFGTTDILDIDGLNMSVYDGANTLLSISGSGVSVFGTSILPGAYHAIVTGTSNGLYGGAYMISVSASPVPVPAAAWLLGSGLLGLVGIARRKDSKSASLTHDHYTSII